MGDDRRMGAAVLERLRRAVERAAEENPDWPDAPKEPGPSRAEVMGRAPLGAERRAVARLEDRLGRMERNLAHVVGAVNALEAGLDELRGRVFRLERMR